MRRLLCEHVVLSHQPFTLVREESLKRLLSYCAQRSLKIPCANTIRAEIVKQHAACKIALKTVFKNARGKVSLTLDAWTSETCKSILSITAHYVDQNWRLQDIVLGARALKGKHTGDNMGKVLCQVLEEFDLLDNIFCITTDNATNSDTLARYVRSRVPSFDPKLQHIPCFGHIINLAAQEGLKQFGLKEDGMTLLPADVNTTDEAGGDDDVDGAPDLDSQSWRNPYIPPLPDKFSTDCEEVTQEILDADELDSDCLPAAELEKLRTIGNRTFGSLLYRLRQRIRAVRSSDQRRQQFSATIAYVKSSDPIQADLTDTMVQLDCPTRWNSTYHMIRSGFEKHAVLAQMIKANHLPGHKSFTDREWLELGAFCKALEPLQKCTAQLSGSLFATASFAIKRYETLMNHMSKVIGEAHVQGKEGRLPKRIGFALDHIWNKLFSYREKIVSKEPLFFAAFLDPHYRRNGVLSGKIFDCRSWDAIADGMCSVMVEAFTDENDTHGEASMAVEKPANNHATSVITDTLAAEFYGTSALEDDYDTRARYPISRKLQV